MAARRIGVDAEAVHRALQETGAPSRDSARGGTSREGERRLPGHVKVEREALRLLLTQPAQAMSATNGLDESAFTAPARRELFSSALAFGVDQSPTSTRMVEGLSEGARTLLTELTVGYEEPVGIDLAERIHEVFVRLRVFHLERDIKARRNVLQDVNPLDDPERHDALFTELVGLEAQRRDLLRRLQGAA